MKSIITGGAGFIGSHLCERLVDEGHEVTVLDNFSLGKKNNLKKIKNKITIMKRDIRNLNSINKLFKGMQNVFHLAALADIVPSIENPDDYYSTNVTGTYNVLKASINNKVKRFIYSASSSCYGIPNEFPTKETSKISPQYPYALTKRLGEELVIHFANIYNLNATSLRLFNVYGPRARTSGNYGAVFGVFLAQKIARKPFTIVGDGKQTRDFTFVSDVIDAMIKVSKKKNLRENIFNVGSGKTISINRIAKLLGGDKKRIPKRPSEPNITFADISKITRKTGWKPKISIEDGIKMMLNNLNDWKDAPVWTPKKINKETKKWFFYLGKKNNLNS
jgi:UDP-glucose 4-epimerase